MDKYEFNIKQEPKFIMLVGLPGSGKSTYAKALAEKYKAVIHSSDSIREEITGSEMSQEENQKVFQILHKRLKNDLKSAKNVIYDATNINYKRRMHFLNNELRSIDCEKICIIVATPYKKCLENNKNRDRSVPEHVIKKMYESFYVPYVYEGWDKVDLYYPDTKYRNFYKTEDFIHTNLNFDQKNEHHSKTLAEHCMCVQCGVNKYFLKLFDVGLLHDCGKPFTKSFKDSKGKIGKQAHYYQHHLVGAYDSLFYNLPDFYRFLYRYGNFDVNLLLERAAIIQWHMQPYSWEKTDDKKQHAKYRKLWGLSLYDNIMDLHMADLASH